MRVKSHSDLLGGLTLFAIAAGSIMALSDLPSGTTGAMGPAYLPRAFAAGLGVIGIGQSVYAFMRNGPPVGNVPLRPIIMVLVALGVFAAGIERLGLLLSSFALLAIASAALPGRLEASSILRILIVSAVGSAAAALLFVVAFGLPMPAFPRL